jgi:hypothetical protein
VGAQALTRAPWPDLARLYLFNTTVRG